MFVSRLSNSAKCSYKQLETFKTFKSNILRNVSLSCPTAPVNLAPEDFFHPQRRPRAELYYPMANLTSQQLFPLTKKTRKPPQPKNEPPTTMGTQLEMNVNKLSFKMIKTGV